MSNFFDSTYYLNKYSDIKRDSNSNEYAKYHFYHYGHKEARHPFDINKFDCNYYKINNKDLAELKTNNELFEHYIKHGQFEKRKIKINNKELISFPLLNINDANSYNKNKQKSIIDNRSSIDRTTNNSLSNISSKNNYVTLVIYVYYNRPGEYKNETNLAFFINQTIKKRNSINDKIEFLFIINNHFTEVNIPEQKNINVLKNKNCLDFEAYLIGINYIERKYSKQISQLYENVMFMNCSCTGPFVRNNQNWLKPFYDKLNNQTVCCTTVLTYISNSYNASSNICGPQIPGYCFLINSKYIHLLINPNNILNNKSFSNTVFGRKFNKYDCIISGEHCVSIVLLKNKLNIASICNPSVDYRNKNNYKHLVYCADRHPAFKYSLYTSIFIKNHWRIDNSNRDCHPVQWSQTKKEIEIQSNYKIISYENLEYNLLNISNNGHVRYNNCKWNSKYEFGRIFADSEEFILFPKSNCNKTIDYYYLNNNNKNYVQKYIIESIKALLYLNYNVIFYTNINNPFKFNYPSSITIKNLENNNNNNNENEIITKTFLNSDLLFPCSDLNKFCNELDQNIFTESIIKLSDYKNNKEKYRNNSYINYLTMYL